MSLLLVCEQIEVLQRDYVINNTTLEKQRRSNEKAFRQNNNKASTA